MSLSIHKQLDKIPQIIKEESFLKSSSLSNELPFYIYDYPPEYEMLVRTKIKYIKKQLKSDENLKIKEFDLFEILIDHIDDNNLRQKIYEREDKKGFRAVLKAMRGVVKPSLYVDQIKKEVGKGDIIFLTGVGKVWPFIRSHTVLNNLHSVIDTKPLIMFFPGKWDKVELRLFDKFKDDNYYRAFKLFDNF